MGIKQEEKLNYIQTTGKGKVLLKIGQEDFVGR